jgi:CDP-diacylglycerol--glycerol-3-phosphate 3-phosphatidyltransferase
MHNLTFSDKILAKVFLPLIPKWITPNHITWFRFISLPFVLYFLWVGDYRNGLILFFLSAFSDAVDGALARTRGQITEWGKTFDPLADKLLISIAVIILVSKFISPFLATTIVLIELFLIGGAYYRKHVEKIPIEAEVSGKTKMVMQSFGVIFILLFLLFPLPALLTIATYLLYLSIVFAIISLVVYKSI